MVNGVYVDMTADEETQRASENNAFKSLES